MLEVYNTWAVVTESHELAKYISDLVRVQEVKLDGNNISQRGDFLKSCLISRKKYSSRNNVFIVKSILKIIIYVLELVQKLFECFTSKPNAHGTF